jgi:hypothetical protein
LGTLVHEVDDFLRHAGFGGNVLRGLRQLVDDTG